MPIRAHHTCKKQGDLTSPSENMRRSEGMTGRLPTAS